MNLSQLLSIVLIFEFILFFLLLLEIDPLVLGCLYAFLNLFGTQMLNFLHRLVLVLRLLFLYWRLMHIECQMVALDLVAERVSSIGGNCDLHLPIEEAGWVLSSLSHYPKVLLQNLDVFHVQRMSDLLVVNYIRQILEQKVNSLIIVVGS